MNRFPSPRMVPRFAAFSFLSALTALSLPAAAQTAGSNVVNIGWFHLYTDDSSQPLRQTSPGSTTFAGSGATVSSADTLGIAYTRFVTDNFAVTLDAGIPPKFKLPQLASSAKHCESIGATTPRSTECVRLS